MTESGPLNSGKNDRSAKNVPLEILADLPNNDIDRQTSIDRPFLPPDTKTFEQTRERGYITQSALRRLRNQKGADEKSLCLW